jgi:ABC-type branched-subunit amino acid transport system substrate-binding protein
MGISVQQTGAAAHALGAAGMPMFGAVTTADGLDGSASPLLARVVPGVSDEVNGLAKYLHGAPKAILVYDSEASDLYTSSLRGDFERRFPGLRQTAIPYVPSTAGSQLFKKIAQELCYTPVQPLVFYAGRNSVFDQFITQLEQEGDCSGKRLTIVTGSDANGLSPKITPGDGGGARVSVLYADIENTAGVTPAFTANFRAWLGRINSPAMTDPWLLASYDAMTAAADAIAEAEGSVTAPGRLTPGNVALWVNQLNASASVNGATGTFSIGAGGDLENPVIPIVRLAAGKAATVTTVKD